MTAARNDVTGDTLVSKKTNDAYRDGWQIVFGKGKRKGDRVYLKYIPEGLLTGLTAEDAEWACDNRTPMIVTDRRASDEMIEIEFERGGTTHWIWMPMDSVEGVV